MAANTQGVCVSFKTETIEGIHNFNVGAQVFKAALYFQGSSIQVGVSAYTTSGEVGGTNYTAGGIVVPNATGVLSSGITSYWTPSGSLVWPNLTISSPFDCALIYNSTQSNRAVAIFTFPAQTVTATTFTIAMPNNVSTSALMQLN